MKIDHVALYSCQVDYGLVLWDLKNMYDRSLLMSLYSSLQAWGNGTKNDVYLLGVF